MNAICAIHGHDYFWRFALRLRMCARCLHLDVLPVPSDAQTSGDPSARNAARRWRPEAVLSPLGGG